MNSNSNANCDTSSSFRSTKTPLLSRISPRISVEKSVGIRAIQKNITIDGIDVPFKASAAVPRLYRLKFRRDIYQDFAALQKSVGENTEKSSALDIESLEVFENIAYIMAKHAAPENVPDNPDDFLEQFNTFSIYEILPQLIDLWGLNVETQVQSKKNIARLTDR